MPPWLYALLFIALLMAVAWVVDRRNSKMRHGLLRYSAARARLQTRPALPPPPRVVPSPRPRPAPSPQPRWHSEGGAHRG